MPNREACARCACNLLCMTLAEVNTFFSKCEKCSQYTLLIYMTLTITNKQVFNIPKECRWISGEIAHRVDYGEKWNNVARQLLYNNSKRVVGVNPIPSLKKLATHFFCQACAPSAVKRALVNYRRRQKNAKS